MEDLEFQFMSSEKEFLNNFGVNFGFVQIHSKISRSYFISSNAKILYTNICQYAYSGKKESFPSQATLRAELGWSKGTLSKYLKELEDVRLISTAKRFGSTLLYYILELNESPALIHSEIIHSARKAYNIDPDLFENILNEYKTSDLYNEIVQSQNPMAFKESIIGWFKSKSKSVEVKTQEPQNKVNTKTIPAPPIIKVEGVIKTSNPDDKKVKAKKDRDHNKVPIEEWNFNHIIGYFEESFQRKFNRIYLTKMDDMAMLKRLLTVENNPIKIKEFIDLYFELDYFSVKSVKNFCSQFTQSTLISYKTTGRLPYQKKDKKKYEDLDSDLDPRLKALDAYLFDGSEDDLDPRLKALDAYLFDGSEDDLDPRLKALDDNLFGGGEKG